MPERKLKPTWQSELVAHTPHTISIIELIFIHKCLERNSDALCVLVHFEYTFMYIILLMISFSLLLLRMTDARKCIRQVKPPCHAW